MINKQDFYNSVMENIGQYLPGDYTNAHITLSSQVKNNDYEQTGIMIRRENDTVCPIIYLESFYDRYKEGEGMDEILSQIAALRTQEAPQKIAGLSPEMLSDYEMVKPMLQMRIYDTERNERRLENIVHHSFGDFSAAYAIVLSSDLDANISVMITPPMLETWGISKRTLHEDTIRSDLEKEPLLMDINEAMFSLLGAESQTNFLTYDAPVDFSERGMPLLCLTNEERQNGAGLILNPAIQEKIATVMGGNYYVLPSSIHEVLILPADGAVGVRELNMMVREINANEVKPQEVLSDKVQIYDAERGFLRNAADYEREQKRSLPAVKAKAI